MFEGRSGPEVVCLKVIDQTSNDMMLGTSAYKRGINATLLAFEYEGIGWVDNITPEPQIIKVGYDIDVPQADKIARAARATWELAGMLTGHAAARMPRQAAADPPARLAARCGHDAAGRRITAEGDQRATRPRDGGVHDGHLHRRSRGTRRGRRDRNRDFRTAPPAASPWVRVIERLARATFGQLSMLNRGTRILQHGEPTQRHSEAKLT
jgi:hypothetical protein